MAHMPNVPAVNDQSWDQEVGTSPAVLVAFWGPG